MSIRRPWDRLLARMLGCAGLVGVRAELPDIRTVPPDLVVPAPQDAPAAPGRRVRETAPGWPAPAVRHTLYLPEDWKPDARFPVLVEFTGNGGYSNAFGDVCTGLPEDAVLGYGLSGGREFLWLSLPYLRADGTALARTWWGDPPAHDPAPTLRYARAAIREACLGHGGDSNRVVFCGFSRGAIAGNALGLHDEETARLWSAFFLFSHYDGVRSWPFPGSDRASARNRLQWLRGRPQFICAEGGFPNQTRAYLAETLPGATNLTLHSTGFRNHSDAWTLRPSPAREAARTWLMNATHPRQPKPGAEREEDKRDQHWSVQPVQSLPELASSLGLQPEALSIDAFILAQLHQKGLDLSPEADRRTLIRRLAFDLHGLPPSPERVERFVNDTDPRACERLVDELLASPHHGERWARHWLDIAHYADTHGFERDQLRPHAWRYRDYVIDSLNADKPYDQFLREQIAGDALAPDDPQSVIATGFLAAGPWDFVGHVETKSDLLKRAARAGDLDDMVTQVITSTMGITIHCARCHDHKLDPITQREYFSLWSVFAGVKRGERDANAAESKRIAAENARITKTLAQKRAEIAKLAGEGLELANLLPEQSGIDLRNGTVTKDKLAYHRDIQTNRLQSVANVPGVKWVFVPDGKGSVRVDTAIEVKGVPATSGHFWDTIANRPLNAQRGAKLGDTDYNAKGHTMLAMHANSGVTFDLAVLRGKSGLNAMRLTGLLGFGASNEAAASLADFTVCVDSEQKFQKLKLRKDETATLDVEVHAAAKTLTLMATDGGDGISHDLLFLGDPQLVAAAGDPRLDEADAAALRQLREEARKLEADLKALPEPTKVYAIVSEGKPPVIKVQRRGDPEDETQDVEPAAFSWAKHGNPDFGDNTTPDARRRIALANWITDPENPLTARVVVNRLWHHHFGQGLVTTPSDFGLGGDKPSHPGLLDYLARELISHGWSLKHIHKLIVMSAAYRQRSGGEGGSDGVVEYWRNGKSNSQDTNAPKLQHSNTPPLQHSTTPLLQNSSPPPLHHSIPPAQLDSSNRLLWRQNPRRLDAESVHDAVLAVSGKMNPERGGPGFRDFTYTEAYAPIYDYISPDTPGLWRRGIYRFIVRTTPHRFLNTLDCPDPANLTPVRMQTTTALQALTLANNDFMLRQARHLAARIETEAPDSIARIRRAFALCFQRPPSDTELQAAQTLVNEQGLFALCRMLMNANEFVYLD